MSCKFDTSIIQKYVDNTIDPLELIILKEHIAVCQDCKLELELMSKLEESMYQYFGNLPENELLDEFSMKILQDCYAETEKSGLGKSLARAWDLNKIVARNAVRYAEYLPGSKLAAKAAKGTGKRINKAVRSYVRNGFKKIIAGTVK